MEISLTESHRLETELLYCIYKKAFAEELDLFQTAFIHKHRLFPERSSDDSQTEDTPLDFARLVKLQSMMSGMSNVVVPRALIEN